MSASARVPDVNGWYEIKDNPLSVAGVYPYKGSSINAPNADQIYYVYRPADELAKPEAVDSLRLLPWIDDHVMLGDSNKTPYTDPEKKGVQGVIGEQTYFKGDTIYGNIKVFSSYLANQIDKGKKQLSCGYRCKYDWSPSKQPVRPQYNGQPYDCIQTNIRFNHLALVQDGRMGPDVAVLDECDCFDVITFDTKDFIRMPTIEEVQAIVEAQGKQIETLGTTIKTMTDGFATGMDAAVEKAVKTTMDAMKPVMDAAAAKGKKPKLDDKGNAMKDKNGDPVFDDDGDIDATMDKKIGTAMDAALEKHLKPLRETVENIVKGGPKSYLGEIAKRDALVSKLTPFIGTFDHADKTLAEVAQYGAEKLGLGEGAKGQEVTAVEFYLHGRSPARRREDTGMDGAGREGKSSVDGFLDGK